jgi:hypothetical protein
MTISFLRLNSSCKPKNSITFFRGNLTVEQYSAKFMELARFALNLILDEETKTKRFLDGLHSRIKERVICLEIKDFTRLVNVALLVEIGLKEAVAAFEQKKRSMPQTSYPAKRPAMSNGSGQKPMRNFPVFQKGQKPTCPK